MNTKELNIDRWYLKGGSSFKMDAKTLSQILDIGGEYEYEPIPLTEDILIKCGFDKYVCGKTFSWNEYRIDIADYSIQIDQDDDRVNDFLMQTNIGDIKITTVHQLQNLIHALTGKELEVKL